MTMERINPKGELINMLIMELNKENLCSLLGINCLMFRAR